MFTPLVCPATSKIAPNKPMASPNILFLATFIPNKSIPTTKVKIGVSEFIIPASALLILVSARGKSIEGIAFPKKPDAARKYRGILSQLRNLG